MKLEIDGTTYPVIIEKKRTTKNLYIRVKEDLSIHVTCHTFTSDKQIEEIIQKNAQNIIKMIERMKRKKAREDKFYFLGKKYDLIYTEFCDFSLGEDKVFLSHDFDLEKWKKKQALSLFQEHLETCYQNFSRKIPHPTLRIRKMKSRWGVCNTKTHVITLNLELITKDIHCLDYVIMHELSHLVEANHSKRFWEVVGENCQDYKKYRKLTNEIGDEEV